MRTRLLSTPRSSLRAPLGSAFRPQAAFLLALTGCSGLLGLDDFSEAETTSATTASGDPGPSSGGAGPTTTTTAQGAGGPGTGGQGQGGTGGSTPTDIEVTPGDTKVGILRALQFEADAAVDWSVEEADGGAIDANGRYISPEEPGVFHVVATSQADPGVSATVEVTVAPLGIEIAGGIAAGPGYLDGSAARARFTYPRGITVVDGQIVISDHGTQTIRVASGSMVTTIAGQAFTPGTQDGVGPAARFENLGAVAGDFNGDRVWVLDGEGNYGPTCIREVDLDTGAVTTLAGRCGIAGYVDSPTASNVRFDGLNSITLSPDGLALYVCHLGDSARVMRRVDLTTGATTTIDDGPGYAMNGGCVLATDFYRDLVYFNAGTNDRQIQSMEFSEPSTYTFSDLVPIPGDDVFIEQMVADTGFGNSDEIYIFDSPYDDVLDQIVPTLYRYTIGETMEPWLGGAYGYVDGDVSVARTTRMAALTAYSPQGVLYFIDRDGHTVRRIDTSQEEVDTIIGTPAAIEPVDGTKAVARLFQPFATAVGDDGTLYVASLSEEDNVIRRIALDGSIDVLAGVRGLENADLTDGPADVAVLGFLFDLVRVGDFLYGLDAAAGAVRRISIEDGEVTTVAGAIGQGEGYVDGFGAAARFAFGEAGAGLATDGTDLFIADAGNFAIRKLDLATNEVTTIAGGTEGTANGTGTDAQFLSPVGLAWDAGTLYVADASDFVIRAIDLESAEVTTLIGQSGVPGGEDGDAGEATLLFPFRLAADGIGNLYVTSYPDVGRTVRRVSLGEPSLSTFAGELGHAGIAVGQLPGTLGCPTGLVIDGAGDLVVTDYCDDAVVAIRPL